MHALSRIISGPYALIAMMFWALPAYAIDLPPEAQRDMYVMSLANHLKAEEWSKAYPYFEKLETLTRKHKLKSDLAVTFYRGEVAYHLKKYAEAEKYLGHYIRKAGSKGSYYNQSLQLLSQVETKKAAQLAEYLRKGKSHARKGSFAKAEPWYRKAAQLGSARAQYSLGWYYRDGTSDGIKKDLAQSLKWTQMAADQNYPKAINGLAQMYRYGWGVPKDVNKAILLYSKSYGLLNKAKYNSDFIASIDAARAVAGMHTNASIKRNREAAYDRDKALSWYKKAAFDAQGNIISYAKGGFPAHGAEALADYYLSEDWHEKEKNYAEAFKLYRLAANEDCVKGFCSQSVSARIKLSRLYLFGTLHGKAVIGSPQEKVDARKNEGRGIKLAKRVKSVEAYYLLANYYYRRAETKNYAEAIKYYSLITKEKARIEGGRGSYNERVWLGLAFFELAQIYEQGEGVDTDFVKAASFYKQNIPFQTYGAIKEHSASRLGIIYLEGKGVKKDYQEAIKWFKKAPRHFGARFRLAGMYEKGLGIKFAERNTYKSEAYKIYQHLVWEKRTGVFYSRENPYLNDDEFSQAKKALDRLAKYRPETIIDKYEEEFITTASGLRYLILEKGEGTTHPKPTDTVTVYYVAKLPDETVIDSGPKNKASSFKLEEILAGFSEGIQLMSSGDKAILVLPPLKERRGAFPANTPIIFEVTLVKFEN